MLNNEMVMPSVTVINTLTSPITNAFEQVKTAVKLVKANIDSGNYGPGTNNYSADYKSFLLKEANRQISGLISAPELRDTSLEDKQGLALRLSRIKDGQADSSTIVNFARSKSSGQFDSSLETLVRTVAENIQDLDIKKATEVLSTAIQMSIDSKDAIDEEYDRADSFGQINAEFSVDYNKAAANYPEPKALLKKQ